jgi:hypothetical protein
MLGHARPILIVALQTMRKNMTSAESTKAIMTAGMPDGPFPNQKSQFGQILEGLRMENVSIFVTIMNISRPSGIFYGHLVIL